jgi:hypothetical protein
MAWSGGMGIWPDVENSAFRWKACEPVFGLFGWWAGFGDGFLRQSTGKIGDQSREDSRAFGVARSRCVEVVECLSFVNIGDRVAGGTC